MKKAPTPKRQWQPMRRGVNYLSPAKIEMYTKKFGVSPLDNPDYKQEVWINDKYVVHVQRYESGAVAHLSIRRQDRGWPRDWRDFQRIKNEIAGPEIEAIELYPAESRLVDTANQFWLWCFEPGQSPGIGFFEGRVTSDNETAQEIGAKQRDFDTYPDISGSV